MFEKIQGNLSIEKGGLQVDHLPPKWSQDKALPKKCEISNPPGHYIYSTTWRLIYGMSEAGQTYDTGALVLHLRFSYRLCR